MHSQKDFQATFRQLKTILQRYEKKLTVTTNKPGLYYLDGAYSEEHRKSIFFGAVAIKKNYVSYHLMPVYASPELLKSLSPALKKRMQGKSCFNFTTIDKATLSELAALTKRGYAGFKRMGFAPAGVRRKMKDG
jgi:hypothetical protein